MADSMARRRIAPISIDRRPIYSLLIPIPVVCFIGALLTDLAYQGSGGNLLWVNFSTWLITAGLVFGGVAAVVLLIDSIRGIGWGAFVLLLAAWIVELINSLVHARDGWTAVVPAGLILSIVGVLLILVSAWLSQSVRCRAAEVRP